MALKYHSTCVIGFDFAYAIQYGNETLSDTEENQLDNWINSFGCPVHVELSMTDLGLGCCGVSGLHRETVEVKVYKRVAI